MRERYEKLGGIDVIFKFDRFAQVMETANESVDEHKLLIGFRWLLEDICLVQNELEESFIGYVVEYCQASLLGVKQATEFYWKVSQAPNKLHKC